MRAGPRPRPPCPRTQAGGTPPSPPPGRSVPATIRVPRRAVPAGSPGTRSTRTEAAPARARPVRPRPSADRTAWQGQPSQPRQVPPPFIPNGWRRVNQSPKLALARRAATMPRPGQPLHMPGTPPLADANGMADDDHGRPGGRPYVPRPAEPDASAAPRVFDVATTRRRPVVFEEDDDLDVPDFLK